MTPQEQQLVEELFDRLAQVENLPRDPEAERLIAQGVGSAPHAVYALTQTALIQDEALKRANVRIEELQAELDGTTASDTQRGSFLDSMRDAVLDPRASARSSVPSVRADAPQTGYGPQSQPPDYPPPIPPGSGGGPPFGGGGSFLGSAASTAAGVIGGALMLDSIRSMFGHHGGGFAPSGLGNLPEIAHHHGAIRPGSAPTASSRAMPEWITSAITFTISATVNRRPTTATRRPPRPTTRICPTRMISTATIGIRRMAALTTR